MPPSNSKSAQPCGCRNPWASLWQCCSHQCQPAPLPTFRPGHLPPWVPTASSVVFHCARSTLATRVCSGQTTIHEGCLSGGLFVTGTLESNKLTTLHRVLCVPAAAEEGWLPPDPVCAWRFQITTTLTVLPPHLRCYHLCSIFAFEMSQEQQNPIHLTGAKV